MALLDSFDFARLKQRPRWILPLVAGILGLPLR
jgi:hypothetical protein